MWPGREAYIRLIYYRVYECEDLYLHFPKRLHGMYFLSTGKHFHHHFSTLYRELFQNIRELGGNKDFVRKREDVTEGGENYTVKCFITCSSKILLRLSKRVRWAGRMTFFGNEETCIQAFGRET
jgi:hypothetical protein